MTNSPENTTGHRSQFGSLSLLIVVIIGFSLLCWQAVYRSELHSSQDIKTLPGNWPDMRLNINTATSAELTVLPGIGNGLADKIVAYRNANGNFHSVDDLELVPMIGKKTIARIKRHIVTE